MPREPEPICTGCGKKLGIVKYSFESIPGAVFCGKCYKDLKRQMES